MKLSVLAVLLGIGFALPQLYALANPVGFREAARKFPRSEICGYLLMGLGTLWFLWNLNAETIADFADYKRLMLIGFGAVGLLTCVYVRDFLAVRGLAVVLLLLAKLTLDAARWNDSPWRVIVSAWAYVWIVAGIWFTISPWRMRDLLSWSTETEGRIRAGSAARLGFALVVILLGLVAF